MINWANFVSQVFNGLALGALLALISSGLTIIYGTLGVLNLAHGAMFMLGGYAGYVAFTYTGSFVVAVIAGSLFVMVVGVVMERDHHPPFLSAGRTRTSFWSPSGSASASSRSCACSSPASRCWCRRRRCSRASPRSASCSTRPIASRWSASSRSRSAALFLVLYRTRLGMIVRAGIEDSVMVDSLGINVYRVFMIVFGIGAMAAGFAGIVNAPVVSLTPGVGDDILVADLRGRGDRRRRLVSRAPFSAA